MKSRGKKKARGTPSKRSPEERRARAAKKAERRAKKRQERRERAREANLNANPPKLGGSRSDEPLEPKSPGNRVGEPPAAKAEARSAKSLAGSAPARKAVSGAPARVTAGASSARSDERRRVLIGVLLAAAVLAVAFLVFRR